jgi:hypothetical protein
LVLRVMLLNKPMAAMRKNTCRRSAFDKTRFAQIVILALYSTSGLV